MKFDTNTHEVDVAFFDEPPSVIDAAGVAHAHVGPMTVVSLAQWDQTIDQFVCHWQQGLMTWDHMLALCVVYQTAALADAHKRIKKLEEKNG